MGLGLNIGADLEASLSDKLDGISNAVKQVGKSQLQIGYRKPVSLQGSIVGISSQVAATNIPGPEAGRLWHIHRISFGTPTIGTAVGTPGIIIVGKGTGLQTTTQGSGQIITSAANQWVEVDRTTTVPGKLTYGRAQFVLISPLNLIVLWSSGTVNVNLVLDIDAYEYLSETVQPS